MQHLTLARHGHCEDYLENSLSILCHLLATEYPIRIEHLEHKLQHSYSHPLIAQSRDRDDSHSPSRQRMSKYRPERRKYLDQRACHQSTATSTVSSSKLRRTTVDTGVIPGAVVDRGTQKAHSGIL